MNGNGGSDADPSGSGSPPDEASSAADETWIWASENEAPRAEPATALYADIDAAYDVAVAHYQAQSQAQSHDQAAASGRAPAGQRGDEFVHPTRVALGMAVLAAERFGRPANDAVIVGIGLAQQTATGLRDLADRVAGPPGRAARRTLDWASRQASERSDRLRGAVTAPPAPAVARNDGRFLRGGWSNAGPLARSRARMDRMVTDARERGQAAVASGRTEASAFLQSSVSDGMAWAEEQAVPQMVDGLVPHLVESVVPKIVDGIVPHLVETVVPQLIDGVMPEIRARVLPVIIDDLTNDPRLRELVLEQSRGVVGEAAAQLRSATATADDRVEQVFRRLVGGQGPSEPPTRSSAEPA